MDAEERQVEINMLKWRIDRLMIECNNIVSIIQSVDFNSFKLSRSMVPFVHNSHIINTKRTISGATNSNESQNSYNNSSSLSSQPPIVGTSMISSSPKTKYQNESEVTENLRAKLTRGVALKQLLETCVCEGMTGVADSVVDAKLYVRYRIH